MILSMLTNMGPYYWQFHQGTCSTCVSSCGRAPRLAAPAALEAGPSCSKPSNQTLRRFRFPLQGSFKGDTDISIDIDMHIDSDMAVSTNWGFCKKGFADLRQLWSCSVGMILWSPSGCFCKSGVLSKSVSWH